MNPAPDALAALAELRNWLRGRADLIDDRYFAKWANAVDAALLRDQGEVAAPSQPAPLDVRLFATPEAEREAAIEHARSELEKALRSPELEMSVSYMLDNEPPKTLAGCYERIRNMQDVIRRLRAAPAAPPNVEVLRALFIAWWTTDMDDAEYFNRAAKAFGLTSTELHTLSDAALSRGEDGGTK